jgi:PAS domain S-box-containing protein
MKFGIKQKILLVLVGGLALTTAFYAGLASYYTNRQNEESAFTVLSRDLLAWQNDLQALTGQLQRTALSASSDIELHNRLKQLITFELNAVERSAEPDAIEAVRALSYVKAVSLDRLRLVLQTGGFSSITAYTGGRLSLYVSDSEAGMMVWKQNAPPIWTRIPIKTDENLSVNSWPAWKEGPLPDTIAPTMGKMSQPTLSVVFPSPEFAAIDIAIPLQGVIGEERVRYPEVTRNVLSLMVAKRSQDKEEVPAAAPSQPTTLAVLVFRKRIDQTVLKEIADKTGKWPVLFSPDGKHQLRLTRAELTSKELLKKAQALPPGKPAPVIQQTVATPQGSFYQTLQPWRFDNQTRLILGLTSSRDSTLQNIRQTVTAILFAAGLILVLSIGVGTFWVGRFIDPIVALTNAVKRIGIKRSLQSEQAADNRITADELQPIDIKAPDEIGELSSAFNAMIAELRNSLETLEQRVQARTDELRQQTQYLRALIDTLPLLVWLKDTQRRYLATNQANAQACGRTVNEIIGKSDPELWPPEIAQRYQADDMEVMQSHQRKTVEEPIDDERGMVWMETFRAPVLDDDGTVLGIVGAARNISERKAAEEAREKALAEAMLLARQRSEFLAQMSHELRTPLNAILGYAEILRRDTQQLTKRQASGLATIQASGQHLLTLINDILDLARVEAGKLELYPTDIDLAVFLRVVGDIIRVKAEEKNLLFNFWASPDLPTSVKADDKRVRQVLLNLLGNAVKFTDSGEIVLRVERAASLPPEMGGESMARLRFEVQDSGIGMSDDQLARLFQPFEQVGDAKRREGGTGLGLAISQQLVRLMGGSIQVKSEPGRGSLFWFELDLPELKTAIAALPEHRPVIGYEGPRKKVLIVDDVPQNRAMLMDSLEPLGFEVHDAKNGQDCLDMLDDVRPDLIVMDVMMPVMDGREATSRIRATPEFAGIPVIMVTASAGPEDEAKGYAAGASAFLAKPIEHHILLKTIGDRLSLQWIAEEAPWKAVEEAEETMADFVIPPREEIEKLYRLAQLGNMQGIREWADDVRSQDSRYAPFAGKLKNLAERYQSKAISILVNQCRTEPAVERSEDPS